MDPRVLVNFLGCGPRLMSLNVEGTSFHDACLSQLIGCGKQLINLNMARTNITDEGFLPLTQAGGRDI
jgi:hypothetical protein